MKSDTERKLYHSEKLHKRKNRMRSHLSKELRSKLKSKKRAVSIRKGDTVRIMRGPHKGKEGKVADVNVVRRKVFLEGITVKNARGRELPVPLEASNLLLVALESTAERKEIFSDEAFRRKEPPKKEAPKAEPVHEGHAHAEHKAPEAARKEPAPAAQHAKPAEHQHEHKAHEGQRQQEAPKGNVNKSAHSR